MPAVRPLRRARLGTGEALALPAAPFPLWELRCCFPGVRGRGPETKPTLCGELAAGVE